MNEKMLLNNQQEPIRSTAAIAGAFFGSLAGVVIAGPFGAMAFGAIGLVIASIANRPN